jgi:hypothetical protein
MGHVEDSSLNCVSNVTVLADDFGKRSLPDLSQLGVVEPDNRVTALVPKSQDQIYINGNINNNTL